MESSKDIEEAAKKAETEPQPSDQEEEKKGTSALKAPTEGASKDMIKENLMEILEKSADSNYGGNRR